MESTVNTYLGDLLKQFSGSISSVSDFAREQIPDVIRQYVMYHLVMDIVACVACLAAILIIYMLGRRVTREINKHKASMMKDFDGAPAFAYTVTWTLVVLSVVFVCPTFIEHTFDLIKITVAPKIWLIERAIELGRGIHG